MLNAAGADQLTVRAVEESPPAEAIIRPSLALPFDRGGRLFAGRNATEKTHDARVAGHDVEPVQMPRRIGLQAQPRGLQNVAGQNSVPPVDPKSPHRISPAVKEGSRPRPGTIS